VDGDGDLNPGRNEPDSRDSARETAGRFLYEYDDKNPALLAKMTGPAHEAETSHEPHRNLITGVVNRGMGFQPMDRAGTSDPQPTAPSLTDAPATAPTLAPAADSGPRTTDQGPRTPIFDRDGNLIEDHRSTYTWDANNNLVRVESKDGTLRLDYLYDYKSRRTVRVETKHPGSANETRKTMNSPRWRFHSVPAIILFILVINSCTHSETHSDSVIQPQDTLISEESILLALNSIFIHPQSIEFDDYIPESTRKVTLGRVAEYSRSRAGEAFIRVRQNGTDRVFLYRYPEHSLEEVDGARDQISYAIVQSKGKYLFFGPSKVDFLVQYEPDFRIVHVLAVD